MCLAVYKNSNFLIAEKDITIYKLVRIYKGLYCSPFFWYRYTPGKTYSETVSFRKQKQKNICFDNLEHKKVKNLHDYLNVRFITKGFHFAFDKHRLINSAKYENKIIVECTIPKGSKFIRVFR